MALGMGEGIAFFFCQWGRENAYLALYFGQVQHSQALFVFCCDVRACGVLGAGCVLVTKGED